MIDIEKWKLYNVPKITIDEPDLNKFEREGKIELKYFIPKYILSGKNQKEYLVNLTDDDFYLNLNYSVDLSGNRSFNPKKIYSLAIPSYISWNKETFEVLGLLQAEMGKTNNGCISFCNNQYKLVKNVIKWFEKELEIKSSDWRWYIKVNLNKPEDNKYKEKIESKVINHWLNKLPIDKNKAHPTIVSYIKNTKNKKLEFYDYGTLIIEYKSNLLSQIIKRFVRAMSYSVPLLGRDENKYFIRGIIAGEGCVEINKKIKKFRIHLIANKKEERDLFQNCLWSLDVNSVQYENYKDIIISQKENHLKLFKLRLMTLNPKKYSKFLNMLKEYKEFTGLNNYRQQFKNQVWNKIPEEKVNRIIELYSSGITRTKEIAEKLGMSKIKVNRVLKENNLGKRLIKISEVKRKEITEFAKNNPKLSQREIAKRFNLHESSVRRAFKKYGFRKSEKDRLKTPIEKINEVIKLYKENPAIKSKEVQEKVKISDAALSNIRRIYKIDNVGYHHVIGTNPTGKNQYPQ